MGRDRAGPSRRGAHPPAAPPGEEPGSVDEPPRHRSLPDDLADLVPAAVYTARSGADGERLSASPQIESILGYPAEAWVADPTLWASRLHPEDRERVLTADDGARYAPTP